MMPSVAPMTMRRKRSVTLMMFVRYSTSMTRKVASVAPTACSDDAVLLRLVELRDDADEEALGEGVDGSQDARPHGAEHQRDDAARSRRRRRAARGRGSPVVGVSTDIQPTVAEASSSTISTPVAVAVPCTVMTPRCHELIGPSSMGVARVEGSGAAQPASAALLHRLVVQERIRHRTLSFPLRGCHVPRMAVAQAKTLSRRSHARSWALGPSHRSMSGATVSRPVHALAISTITSLSKCRLLRLRRVPLLDQQVAAGLGDRRAQVDVAAPGCMRVSTTYLDSTASSAAGSAASKRMVTMASSISSGTAAEGSRLAPVADRATGAVARD